MKAGGSLSIWFFVGLALGVTGLMILIQGIHELAHPPDVQVVLYQLRANIWWGAVLTILGAVYCYYYRPGRQQS